MTREEAKREIDFLDYYLQNHTDDYDEESHTAMMMAIQALEQEPCEDAISREDVINLKWRGEASEEFLEGYANAIEDARVLPSVKPQERTGHWIIIDDCEKFIAKCSECGQIEDSRMIGKYTYCHCGARMEVEQNG